MLPAQHRLRESADFAATVRDRRQGGRRLVVHLHKTDARVDSPPRVGFVVSKAVGNAVVRNRTKRRLRALMAARMSLLPSGCDLVIRANPAAAGATFQELGGDLDRQLTALVAKAVRT